MRHATAVVSFGLAAMLAPRPSTAGSNVPEKPPATPPVIRISVDAIQLDAVITDKKGRHVTDLTSDEIEIFQDGEKQPISQFSYVRSGVPAAPPAAPPPAGQAPASPGEAPAAATSPTTPRTVLIVLDDLSFGPHAFDRTLRALRHAVERLDPKDRVDIVTTSAGFQTLTLTTDRKANRDAIAAVRRTPWTRAELANRWQDASANLWQDASFRERGRRYDGSVFDNVDDWMALRSIEVVKVAIKALRDVPGRKALLLVSEGLANLRGFTLPQVRSIYWPLDRLYGDTNDLFGALKRLAELGARSGVVIHAVDPRGLVTAGLGVEDSISDIHNPREYGNAVVTRHVSLYAAQSTLQYLTDKTGGLTRVDDNDMAASFASIVNDLSGYYLIGYTPRSGTFDSNSFHKFEMKVKRPGLRVRTREGFYPVTDEQVATALR